MDQVLTESPNNLRVVGNFQNDTNLVMRLYLEMLCEEVVFEPGQSIELLEGFDPDILPLTIGKVDDGIHVHPNRVGDPNWHIRYKGKLIKPGFPTFLSDHD